MYDYFNVMSVIKTLALKKAAIAAFVLLEGINKLELVHCIIFT